MNDITFASVIFSFAVTYLLHSTVLLAGCWVIVRVSRTKSYILVERLWRMGAVLGLVTAVI